MVINSTFCNFFSKLYCSEVTYDPLKSETFFKNLNLPKLSPSKISRLEAPITLVELETALRKMNKGKSPGFDGIPPEFLLRFWSNLGPLILNMINYSIDMGSFSRDVNLATITLLLKKGKDPNDCANYRPISLLNSDIKLFAKVLALRLEPLMGQLVNPDQTGFINPVCHQTIFVDFCMLLMPLLIPKLHVLFSPLTQRKRLTALSGTIYGQFCGTWGSEI